MASRGGPTISGTDGSDYGHREKVAAQYRTIVLSKSNLKLCLLGHFISFLIIFARQVISTTFDIWQYIWYCSVVFILCALVSVRRNQVGSMQIFLVANVFFGLVPALFGLLWNAAGVWQEVLSRGGFCFSYGLFWFCFMWVVVTLHCFSLYFGASLISAWRARGGQKKIN